VTAGAGPGGGAAPVPRAYRTAPVLPGPPAGTLAWRVPAVWVTAGLLVAGGASLGTRLAPAVRHYPFACALAVLLFALYAVPFLIFIDRLDFLEREPPPLLAMGFAWGGVVSTAAAIPGNAAAENLLAKLGSPALAGTWGPALAGPTVEEPLKLLGVVMVALVVRGQINSVVDGFVYGAVVGLGFQVVEDVLYAANQVNDAGDGDRAGPVLGIFVARGFLAGLWSHTLFTALAGAGVAYALVRRARSRPFRLGMAALGLLGAWLCHAFWNSPLLRDGWGLGVPGVLLALVVKGIPALVVILALVKVAGDHEGEYYAATLAELADPLVATAAELDALRSPGARAAVRREAAARCGRRGGLAVGRLQRAQAALAVALSRCDGTDGYWRDEVLRARRALAALDAAAGPRVPVRRWVEAVVWFLGTGLAALLALALAIAVRRLG
jgi:protease PrsW